MSLWVGGCVVCKSPFNLRVNLRNEPLGGHSNILESVLKKLGFVSCTFVWQSSNLEVHYRVMTNYNHVIWEESIAVKSAFILHCFFLWSEGWMGEGASLKEPGKNKTTQGERERERERELHPDSKHVMGAEGLLWSHGSSWWWWPTKMALFKWHQTWLR